MGTGSIDAIRAYKILKVKSPIHVHEKLLMDPRTSPRIENGARTEACRTMKLFPREREASISFAFTRDKREEWRVEVESVRGDLP